MSRSFEPQLAQEVAEKVGRKYARIMDRPWFRYFRHLREEVLKRYLREHPDVSLDTTLDLGCADNVHLKLFPPQTLKIGIDLSLQALVTSGADSSSHRVVGDACLVPLKSRSVHFVLASGLLHHVHAFLNEVLQEIHRVLVPGGVLYVDEPNGSNPLWHLILKSPIGTEVDGGITQLLTAREIVNAASLFRHEEQIWYGLSKKPAFAVRSVVILRKQSHKSP